MTDAEELKRILALPRRRCILGLVVSFVRRARYEEHCATSFGRCNCVPDRAQCERGGALLGFPMFHQVRIDPAVPAGEAHLVSADGRRVRITGLSEA